MGGRGRAGVTMSTTRGEPPTTEVCQPNTGDDPGLHRQRVYIVNAGSTSVGLSGLTISAYAHAVCAAMETFNQTSSKKPGVLIAVDTAVGDPVDTDNTLTIAEGIMLGVGLGMVAGGIPLWVTSKHRPRLVGSSQDRSRRRPPARSAAAVLAGRALKF